MTDQLKEIRDDVRELREWSARHEERHGDDADMLGRVLDSLQNHLANHHSRLSTIKQSSGITAALLMLGAFAELLRRLFL